VTSSNASFQQIFVLFSGKYTDALFWLDEAIWVDPKGDVDVFVHRGKILKKLNNLEDALVCFEKALLFVLLLTQLFITTSLQHITFLCT